MAKGDYYQRLAKVMTKLQPRLNSINNGQEEVIDLNMVIWTLSNNPEFACSSKAIHNRINEYAEIMQLHYSNGVLSKQNGR